MTCSAYCTGAGSASQIVQATRSNDAYSWGGHGNGSTSTTTNGLNQITAWGSASPTYDAKGNMTSDGTQSFTYSSENYLTGTGSTTLTYDPLGRYAATNYYPGRQFLYDGNEMLEEFMTGYTVVARFIPDPATGQAIYIENGGYRYWPMTDERGSVIAMSNDTGAAGFLNRYDEYGVPQAITGAGNIPARPGCSSSARNSTITRPASTTPGSAGSCRPIPSATATV